MYPSFTNTVNCPVCNSPIGFIAAANTHKVCSICNSVMEKMEDGSVKVSPVDAATKNNRSVIQTGTRGSYKKQSFEVTGCIHCDTERQYINQWSIVYQNGKTGLLIECLGLYAIAEKIVPAYPEKFPQVKKIALGVDATELVKGRMMYVFDRAKCLEKHIEGEVYYPGQLFTITELVDKNNLAAEVLEYQNDYFELYSKEYITLQELSITVTVATANLPVMLSCDSCGKPVTIRLPQYALHCVCPNCNKWNEINNAGSTLKARDKKFKPFTPALPIGSKGVIKDLPYEVIGATEKNEAGSSNTKWREYTLYNASTGFAFLAEYNGHWSYIKEIKSGMPWPYYKEEITVGIENFVLFNDYRFNIVSAAGEFVPPLTGGNISAREFISPPEMYMAENNDGKEITWYKGEYISNSKVFEGLNVVEKTMPPVVGVGPLQPMKAYISMGLLKRISIAAFLLLFITQIILTSSAKNETIFSSGFYIGDSLSRKSIVTEAFELKQASSNLEFIISAPVNNSWFEADVTLINDRTGKEYSFEKGVEYYSGYTDGESWTEGSKDADILLSSVPKGKYHLNIFPTGDPLNRVSTFSIQVTNDVPVWRNFFLLTLLLGLYPFIMWWRTQSFEKRRWNNEPIYSNNTGDDGD